MTVFAIVDGFYAREFELYDPDFHEFVEAYTSQGDSVVLVDKDIGKEMIVKGEIDLVEVQ